VFYKLLSGCYDVAKEECAMVQNLKCLRIASGISQKALADVVGVSQQSINKYENQGVEPDIATLIRIAEYFNTSVDYLIGRSIAQDQFEITQAHALSGEERRMLETFRKLSDRQKSCISSLIFSFFEG
jgi:transcriptional regulator with XRE-family HTH domain